MIAGSVTVFVTVLGNVVSNCDSFFKKLTWVGRGLQRKF
jgi:hypothetical protein